MLISTLVTDALYLSLYDRELQPAINGGVTNAALNTLNYIFDESRDLIPYPVEYTFNSAAELLNTPFVSVDNVNYLLPGSNVKQPLLSKDLTDFNKLSLIVGQQSIPNIYYFDPLLQNINIYPLPSQVDSRFIVWGRAALGPLTLNSALPQNMPIFMANALIYELAGRLAGEKGAVFNERKERTRLDLIGQLKSKRQVSLSTPRDNVFGSPNGKHPFPFFYYLSGGGS